MAQATVGQSESNGSICERMPGQVMVYELLQSNRCEWLPSPSVMANRKI